MARAAALQPVLVGQELEAPRRPRGIADLARGKSVLHVPERHRARTVLVEVHARVDRLSDGRDERGVREDLRRRVVVERVEMRGVAMLVIVRLPRRKPFGEESVLAYLIRREPVAHRGPFAAIFRVDAKRLRRMYDLANELLGNGDVHRCVDGCGTISRRPVLGRIRRIEAKRSIRQFHYDVLVILRDLLHERIYAP